MLSRWCEFDPLDMAGVPPIPACYVIFVGPHPVYVGQSRNLRQRILQYKFYEALDYHTVTPWGAFQDVSIRFAWEEKFGHSLMLEARLIRRLQPRFNIRGKRE